MTSHCYSLATEECVRVPCSRWQLSAVSGVGDRLLSDRRLPVNKSEAAEFSLIVDATREEVMNHDQDQTFYLWYDFYWKWDCTVFTVWEAAGLR